jgi:hypothetical protein
VAAYNPTFKLDDVWKLAEGKFEAVTGRIFVLMWRKLKWSI